MVMVRGLSHNRRAPAMRQSGDFRQVIVENIRARAHFLVLLTPSALERVDEPDDVVRLEIETALDARRNIVPLMLDGFNFATASIASRLTGKLLALKNYSGLSAPSEYFWEAMARLRMNRLNVSVNAVLHPVSPAALAAAADQGRAASAAPAIDSQDFAASRARIGDTNGALEDGDQAAVERRIAEYRSGL